MTPRLYRKMLRLGFRWQRRHKARVALLRHAPMQPAVLPIPHFVNNNAVVRKAWRPVLKRVYAKHPVTIA